MADSIRDCFVDIFANSPTFVVGANSNQSRVFQPPYHGNKIGFTFTFLKANPDGGLSSPYTIVDLSGASLSFKVFDSTGVTVLVSEAGWTVDATHKFFSGAVDFYTSPMISQIASTAATALLVTILEITLTLSDGSKYTFRNNSFQVGKSLDLPGTPSAVGADTYYTTVQSDGRYVRQDGVAGGFFLMRSASGKKVQIYIADIADGGIEFRAEQVS